MDIMVWCMSVYVLVFGCIWYYYGQCSILMVNVAFCMCHVSVVRCGGTSSHPEFPDLLLTPTILCPASHPWNYGVFWTRVISLFY